MGGFGFRDKPSQGVRRDIWVRALALDSGNAKPALLVTIDLVSIDTQTADEIAARCLRSYGISRDRLAMNVSHTHSAPVAGLVPMPMYEFTPADRETVKRYTKDLIDKTVAVAGQAVRALAPARLEFEQGLAGVGVNRRRVRLRSLPGPVDHDVPVLAVRDAAGALRAVVVGYACHATALSDYLISNDWPGFALEAIEQEHPGATALFVQGAGADSNPLPRSGEDLARKHGEVLAAAVEQVLKGKMKPVPGPLRTAFDRATLPLRELPSRGDLQKRVAEEKSSAYRAAARNMLAVLEREGKLPDHCPYPVQVWQFGDGLKLIYLSGEVVVDYSLRLKRQYGFDSTWIAGYSNDVLGYIPSRRVLEEGGYEGGDALILFGRPGKFGSETEDIIVKEVGRLVRLTKASKR